jgi:hypothetical protein
MLESGLLCHISLTSHKNGVYSQWTHVRRSLVTKLHRSLTMPPLILLLSLHNPITMIFRILLPPHSFVLIFSFILKLLGHIQAPLHRWPLIDRIQPLLGLREWVKLDAGQFGPVHPSETRQVRIVHLSPTIQGPSVPGPQFGRVELEPPEFKAGVSAAVRLRFSCWVFKDLVETFGLLC